MLNRMQQRRGSSSQWTSINPVLAEGEIGFETDSQQFKIGDGVLPWSQLPYYLNKVDVEDFLQNYLDNTTYVLSDLQDIDLENLEDGFTLIYSADLNAWVAESPTLSISNLSDVDLTDVDDNNVLIYDSAIPGWIASSIPAPQSISEILPKSESYTLEIEDINAIVEMDSSENTSVIIPKNEEVDFPVKTEIHVLRVGTGEVLIEPVDSDVSVAGTPGLKLRDQWSMATLIKRGTNSWVVIGDLVD
jgi:hypothetical protein